MLGVKTQGDSGALKYVNLSILLASYHFVFVPNIPVLAFKKNNRYKCAHLPSLEVSPWQPQHAKPYMPVSLHLPGTYQGFLSEPCLPYTENRCPTSFYFSNKMAASFIRGLGVYISGYCVFPGFCPLLPIFVPSPFARTHSGLGTPGTGDSAGDIGGPGEAGSRRGMQGALPCSPQRVLDQCLISKFTSSS